MVRVYKLDHRATVHFFANIINPHLTWFLNQPTNQLLHNNYVIIVYVIIQYN